MTFSIKNSCTVQVEGFDIKGACKSNKSAEQRLRLCRKQSTGTRDYLKCRYQSIALLTCSNAGQQLDSAACLRIDFPEESPSSAVFLFSVDFCRLQQILLVLDLQNIFIVYLSYIYLGSSVCHPVILSKIFLSSCHIPVCRCCGTLSYYLCFRNQTDQGDQFLISSALLPGTEVPFFYFPDGEGALNCRQMPRNPSTVNISIKLFFIYMVK